MRQQVNYRHKCAKSQKVTAHLIDTITEFGTLVGAVGLLLSTKRIGTRTMRLMGNSIYSAADTQEKPVAGASLGQLYMGFMYEGSALMSCINKALAVQREQLFSLPNLALAATKTGA